MNRKKILTAAIVTLLSAGAVTVGINSVLAADHGSSGATKSEAKGAAQSTKLEQNQLKLSQDAMLSMRDVSEARFALFEGQVETARTDVDAALTRINAAVQEAETYAIDLKSPEKDDWYVPFDTQITLLDAYKEQEKGKGGESHTAAKTAGASDEEALELTEVDFAVSSGLIPVKFARQQITEAAKLIETGDYYAANLALKAVGDAVIIQTVAIDEPIDDESS
ncbi:MAG: YfdX family protein [Lysobacterales bacterium]|jgi:hypothetical protein